MSEETEAAGDGAEPSMEDILASIRKILAEEEDEEGKAAEGEEAAAEAPDAAAPEPAPEPEPASEPMAADDIDAMFDPAPEPEAADLDFDEPAPEPEPAPAAEPEPVDDPFESIPDVEPEPIAAAPAPEPVPQPMADIMELTPDMVAPDAVMSQPTSLAGSDVLQELARAVLDRRDLPVYSSGDHDTSIEGIVREMLKPILREWLDRNLPYLIERLVKKEIDTMVNRAEGLDNWG